MAEATEENLNDEASLEGAQKRFSKKKLILFIILPFLLIIGAGAGLHFTGKLDKLLNKDKTEESALRENANADESADDIKGPGHYYNMADLIINLNDTGSKQRFLKLSISLELASVKEEAKLMAVMPRITDHFQTYLRELRVEDLRGSAGIYRLRQELLARVRNAADPVKIRDVLFREILIQ